MPSTPHPWEPDRSAKDRYAVFLKSPEWARIRQDAFTYHGDSCMGCGSSDRVQPHHIFYPFDVMQTQPWHMMVLCHECHGAIHKSKIGATVKAISLISTKRREIIAHLKRLKNPYLESELRRRRPDIYHTPAPKRKGGHGGMHPRKVEAQVRASSKPRKRIELEIAAKKKTELTWPQIELMTSEQLVDVLTVANRARRHSKRWIWPNPEVLENRR